MTQQALLRRIGIITFQHNYRSCNNNRLAGATLARYNPGSIRTSLRQQHRWNTRNHSTSGKKQQPPPPPSTKTQPPQTTPKELKNSKNKIESNTHDISSSLKSFSIGSFAGVLGSLAGMGGGFVMIPLMTSSILRLSQHTAHGTSLFAVASTGIAGAAGYGLKDVVEIDYAMAVALGGMITARFGAIAATRLSGSVLKKALGVFMICIAPVVPAKTYIAEHFGGGDTNRESGTDGSEHLTKKEMFTMERLLPSAMIGLGSGFLAGMFGVGGGAVVVPALTITTDMTHYQALGTSLCAMTMPAMVGTWTHFKKGNVALRVAFPLAFGSFVGAYAGSKIGLRLPEEKLRWGFSALMFTLGSRTLLKV